MAVRRSGGSVTAYAVAVVVLGILFFLSLVLAIIYYTQLDKQTIELNTAREELAKVITSDDRAKLVTAIPSDARGSAVGLLMEENNKLKLRITGNEKLTYQGVEGELTRLAIGPENTLVTVIRSLQADKKASADDVATMKADRDAANARAKEAEDRRAAEAQRYAQSTAELRGTLTKLEQDLASAREEARTLGGGFEERLTAIQTEGAKSVTEKNTTIDQKDQEISALKRRINELMVHASPAVALMQNPPVPADGKILSILTEENLVYTDLGEAQHVLPGMTFEVYDANEVIKLDEYRDLRGKATVEVISVSGSASVARVVRTTRGRTVNEGDQIVNLVFDPNAVYKFFVFGDFDIDNSGQATQTDLRRVKSMVVRWGGKLSDADLTYDVDFLVLGVEPKQPEKLDESVIDPNVIEANTRAEMAYKRYQDLIQEAKRLSIPVLNQNRFLTLVGYYKR